MESMGRESAASSDRSVFYAEMRRQEKPELTEELKGLQEEILVNYGRGRFIVAVHKENGMPMLKQKNGDAYQPIFTDILEFRKFNKEDQFKTMAIEAKKCSEDVGKRGKRGCDQSVRSQSSDSDRETGRAAGEKIVVRL